ncbi:MAG: hypothetical protein KAV87_37300, partial [Desulfobacteraceae bacterium]|nr:hypothetical protein [Desulfobacteraceae bacterium]
MPDIFDKIGGEGGGGGLPKRDIFDDISPERTLVGTAKDVGIDLLKGAISVPEAAVGLADMPTGGRAGKGLESLGFKPGEAKEILSEQYSPARKEAGKKFSEAEGLVDKTVAAVSNPSVVASAVLESLPLMGAGGAVARGIPLLGAGGRALSGVARSAIGEGTVAAGSAAEGVRQQTDEGLLTGKQAALAGITGALTGAFTHLGGKVADELGIADVHTYLAGAGNRVRKKLARRTVEGFISEGVLEELPQSVQEQMIQNISLDRPAFEGVDEAAVLGVLSGGVMGGAFNIAAGDSAGPIPDLDKIEKPSLIVDKGEVVADMAPKGPIGAAAAAGGLGLRTPAFIPDERRVDEIARLAARDAQRAAAEKNLEGFKGRSRGLPSTAAESAEVITGIPAGTLAAETEKETAVRKEKESKLAQTFASLPTEEQEAAAKAEAEDVAAIDPIHGLRAEIKKRGGLNLDNLKVDYDSESTKAMIAKAGPGIVSSKGTVQLDDIADEMGRLGIKSADDLLRGLTEAPSKAEATTAAEKEIQAARDNENRMNERADELEEKGFDPVFEKQPAISFNKGDKISTAGDPNIPADEYEVKGIDADGKIILQDGVTRKVDGFDSLSVDGVKRSGEAGLGLPFTREAEKVEAEPSAAAPSPEPAPSPAAAVAEGDVSPVLFADAKTGDRLVSDREQYLVQKGIKLKEEATKLAKDVGGDVVLDREKWAVVSDNPVKTETEKAKEEKFRGKMQEVIADKLEALGGESPLSTETIDNKKSIAHGQEVNTSPSEAMKEAENYKKAHVLVDGLEISVENPVGSERSGMDDDGKKWSQTMKSDYGYFKRSVGFDKDHVDVFLKPSYTGGNDTVHIVNQVNRDGSFDEHKVVLGATSEKDALLIYKSNYEKGWTGGKSVASMPLEAFQEWVKSSGPAKGEVRTERRALTAKKERVERRADLVNESGEFRRQSDVAAEILGDMQEDEQGNIVKLDFKNPEVKKHVAATMEDDVVPEFIDSKQARIMSAERAQELLKLDPEMNAYYIEMDIANVGGGNNALGNSGFDVIFGKIGTVIANDLDKNGGKYIADKFRHGGDELSAVTVGKNLTQESIEEAL